MASSAGDGVRYRYGLFVDVGTMTRAEFDQKCAELCPHCKDGIALRYRGDTREFVHDGAIQIPGTLGRRQSHAFCLASDFRKENEGKIK